MKPALLFGLSHPPARTFILIARYGLRARPAADRGIAPIVKRVVRNVMLGNERPHVFGAPIQEGIDFHESEFLVPLHDACYRPVDALTAPDRTYPGVIAGDRSAPGQNLAVPAALIGLQHIQWTRMLRLIIGYA